MSLVRVADATDAETAAQLLHEFNSEYDDFTPGPVKLGERLGELLGGDDPVVLLAGVGPDGIAVLRFRPSIWTRALECYLAELYVRPDRRGQGLGRALMAAAVELARSRGADYMDLATGEDDIAARTLYETFGFSRSGGTPDAPPNYYYERQL